MRKLIVIIILFLCFDGYAQPDQKNPIYFNGGLSVGNISGSQAGVNFIFNRNISLQLEFSGTSRRASSTPDDYSGGIVSIFALNSNAPKDMIRSFRIMPGIVSYGKKAGKLRVNFKAGVSFLTLKEPENWVFDPLEGLFLAPNYSWDYKTKYKTGVVLKTDFDIITRKHVGFSISPCLEIGEITSVGVAFNLLLGKVRKTEEQIAR